MSKCLCDMGALEVDLRLVVLRLVRGKLNEEYIDDLKKITTHLDRYAPHK